MNTRYVIGFDCGIRSLGAAAIEIDADGNVIRILSMATFQHDGGVYPGKAKEDLSRMSSAGSAKRTRKMYKQTKKRLADLDQVLRDHGFPVPDEEEPQTYQAWESRALLSREQITDQADLYTHLTRAVRHIARHRGWRNPWWNYTQLEADSYQPTEGMTAMLADAEKRWGSEAIDDYTTVGELCYRAANPDTLIRPRQKRKMTPLLPKPPQDEKQDAKQAQQNNRLQQSDQLAEIRRYWDIQDLPAEAMTPILEAVFYQIPPSVPDENVGRDPLPGQRNKPRAPKASLEFQEYRIRAAIANLRVHDAHTKRPLTREEYDHTVAFLLNYNDAQKPTWAEVADHLSLEPDALIAPVIDDVRLNAAPIDTVTIQFEKKTTKKSPIRQWWDTATPDQRGLLIRLITDTSNHTREQAHAAGLLEITEQWPIEEFQALAENKNWENGRAVYSADSLARLNACMAENAVDPHEARKTVFNIDDSWTPPAESWETPIHHPVVDRVMTLVRRFVGACDRKWGPPEDIIVEHVRESFQGREEREKTKAANTTNRNRNEEAREAIRQSEHEKVSTSTIKRYRAVQRQGNTCLYCGGYIGLKTAEMDHIVPRAGGGNSTTENLVAVCRTCNAAKGKLPFPAFAAKDPRPEVSLNAAIDRLKSWNEVDTVAGRRLKRKVTLRLKQRNEDAPIDERTLASTAYAATEIRRRLVAHFNTIGAKTTVHVYRGALTREARRASGIDRQILLRGNTDKNRLDKRHHAIDAAVLTLLKQTVAETLAMRESLRREEQDSQHPTGWKDFRGLTDGARFQYQRWLKSSRQLGDLITDAIDEDTIPVVKPLRLTPRQGEVHDASISAITTQPLEAEWTAEQIKRVVNRSIYLTLIHQLGPAKSLPADPNRTVTLPSGKTLAADEPVEMFTTNAASVRLSNRGSATIGTSMHHVRLYASPTKNGKPHYTMLRVFGAEFPWLMRRNKTKDVLHMPIPEESFTYRELPHSVKTKINAPNTQEIGWIVKGDEVEIDPTQHLNDNNKLAEFLHVLPERRWRVSAFNSHKQLIIKPATLSAEGKDEIERMNHFSEEEKAIIRKRVTGYHKRVQNKLKWVPPEGIQISPNVLFGQGAKIIRRNNLGTPQWKGKHTPTSFTPNQRFYSHLDAN